jgi:hypothetical protein
MKAPVEAALVGGLFRFAIGSQNAYVRPVPSKPLDLPLDVAKAFIKDMHAFFAAGGTGVKADGIAAMQLHALKQHYSGKLRITDVKRMFLEMKDEA